MKYDPDKHHRKSIRIPGYDYSQKGWYFVTICINHYELLLGDVVDGEMVLNEIGKLVVYHWIRLPQHFKHIELDQYQIMPNHLHGIIHIIRKMTNDGDNTVGAMHSNLNNQTRQNNIAGNASPVQRLHGTIPGSLGAIMQNFQSITCRKIHKINKTLGSRLWQRNYWEHVIRDENDLNRIRDYIINNPLKWPEDKYYS
jgi:REP element-mobilizing transposase RayT